MVLPLSIIYHIYSKITIKSFPVKSPAPIHHKKYLHKNNIIHKLCVHLSSVLLPDVHIIHIFHSFITLTYTVAFELVSGLISGL